MPRLGGRVYAGWAAIRKGQPVRKGETETHRVEDGRVRGTAAGRKGSP
jgi:hypothetical protein